MSKQKSATPRLTLRTAATFLLFALGGVAVGALDAHWKVLDGSRLALTGAGTAALVLLAVLLLPLLVLWHELGHLAGGRWVGFRPLLLVVGPVRWQKRDGRWRMGVNRSAALAGGLAACAPQGSHDLARRTAGLIAGGPLASLAGGGVGTALWLALPPLGDAPPFAAVAGYTALGVFGIGNLLLALLSLTPTRAGGFYSDGARLLRIWRGGPELDREVALLLLTGITIGGTRPGDWDPELVRRAVGEPDGTLFHAMGLQLAFAHAEDRGETDRAREYLRALLDAEDAFPPLLRPALRLGVVPFVACHERDAARAGELVRGGEGGLLIDGHIRHLARAAAAWAGGDAARAAAELDRAEALLPGAVDRGAAVAAAAPHADHGA